MFIPTVFKNCTTPTEAKGGVDFAEQKLSIFCFPMETEKCYIMGHSLNVQRSVRLHFCIQYIRLTPKIQLGKGIIAIYVENG